MADDTPDDPRYRGSSPHEISAVARRVAQYCIRIVQAATAAGLPGQTFDSAVRCRRRPDRRACPGHLRVMLVEVPEQVRWSCSQCDDGGTISGWRGAPWDLSEAALEVEGEMSVLLAPDVYRALDELAVVDPEAERVIKGAETIASGMVRLTGSIDELEILAGGLAAEVHHEPNRRRARLLNTACDRLDEVV